MTRTCPGHALDIASIVSDNFRTWTPYHVRGQSLESMCSQWKWNSIKLYYITWKKYQCSEGGLPICIEECYREALVHKIFSLGAIIFAFVATKLLMTQSQGHQQDMGLTTVKSFNLLKEYSSWRKKNKRTNAGQVVNCHPTSLSKLWKKQWNLLLPIYCYV